MTVVNKIFRTSALFGTLLLGLSACGGGGGGSGAPNTTSTSGTQSTQTQKKVTIAFSTISTANHAVPMEGVQLTVKMPVGVITDSSCSLTWRDSGGSVPVYDAANLTVTFAHTDIVTPLRFGTFADLTCDLATGSALTESVFTPAALVQDKQIVGYAGGGSVNMSDTIAVGTTATISTQ